MATSRGRQDPPVTTRLFDAGYEFNFFQAVNLLARASRGGMFSRLGAPAQPSREIVRFEVHQSLAFPPSPIHRIARDAPDKPPCMTVAFFGLTGFSGVLPHFYTEVIRQCARRGDSSGAAFLDIFNHRLISLFYYAWEKHHPVVSWARESRAPEAGLPQYLFDLFGMGTRGLRGRMSLPDRTLLLYAGLFAQRPRSAAGLEGILRDYFRVPVTIEQFRGEWLPVGREHLSCMDRDGMHNQLGAGAIAGTAVWHEQARFRVALGPLTFQRLRDFLPHGSAFAALRQLTEFYVERMHAFDVKLILLAAHVPECSPGGDAPDTPRLGLTSWLKTESFGRDADDLILESELSASPQAPGE